MQDTHRQLVQLLSSFQEALGRNNAAFDALTERIAALDQEVARIARQLEDIVGSMGAATQPLGPTEDDGQPQTKALRSVMKEARRDRKDFEEQLKTVARAERKDLQEQLKAIQGLVTFGISRTMAGTPAAGAFLATAQPLIESRRTMLGYDRLFTLWEAARAAAHLALPCAEIGVFRGGSAFFLAQALRMFAGDEREMHVVDTFEGHPVDMITERDSEQQRGKFTATSYDDVAGYLSGFKKLHVYKGAAREVIAGWPERQYCLVHLDVDLYLPTLECLRYFGPRLACGGIIIIDDYGALNCPGVAQAVREHLAEASDFEMRDIDAEQILLIRR